MGGNESQLRDAARDGDIVKATSLLSKGTDVNCKDGFLNTPLMIASMYGQHIMAHLLIQYGANINMKNEDGMSALYTASRYGFSETVDFLCKNKACKIDLQDKWGWTPLYAASHYNHVKVVDMLIKYGATVDVKNKEGKSAYDASVEKKHTEITRTLGQKKGIVQIIDDKQSASPPNTVYSFKKMALSSLVAESTNSNSTSSVHIGGVNNV